MSTWLSSSDLALAAGISSQKARAALSRAARGLAWRHTHLVVRTVTGRGGTSGWSYEVRFDSLPAELRLRIEAPESSSEDAFNPSLKASSAAAWWSEFLRPALAHPRYSRERAAAIRALAGQRVCGPHGKWFTPSGRDIERKVAKASTGGLKALMRKRREVKLDKRLLLSVRWDKAVADLDPETRARIAKVVLQDLRNLWASKASLTDVQRLSSERLEDLTAAAGFSGTAAELTEACQLPRHVVERDRRVRRVHEFKNDRKAFEDSRPRIRRTTEGLRPMQLVLGDVHHTDTLIERPDGTTATPKLIAWLDVGTRRFRCDIILCDAGKGVRNADLIASFLNMVRDPAWGMPEMLYLDNGSEYAFAEFLKDAMQLTGLHCEGFDRRSPIVRSKAYNAAAKGLIEGAFGVIERTLFASIPGYIGGDRMKSKTANVGRAPTPYGLGFDSYRDTVQSRITYYNTRKQTGGLKGRTPNDVYHLAVQDGWTRTTADDNALFMAFSTTETRIVRRGKIEARGVSFYCPELFRHEGERVTIRLPKYTDWNAVPVFTIGGALIGIAHEEVEYPYLSKDGARAASEMEKQAKATIKALAETATPVDLTERMRLSAARAGGVKSAPIGGCLTVRDEEIEIGRAVREAPGARQDRERAEKQRAAKARLEQITRFGETL